MNDLTELPLTNLLGNSHFSVVVANRSYLTPYHDIRNNSVYLTSWEQFTLLCLSMTVGVFLKKLEVGISEFSVRAEIWNSPSTRISHQESRKRPSNPELTIQDGGTEQP